MVKLLHIPRSSTFVNTQDECFVITPNHTYMDVLQFIVEGIGIEDTTRLVADLIKQVDQRVILEEDDSCCF